MANKQKAEQSRHFGRDGIDGQRICSDNTAPTQQCRCPGGTEKIIAAFEVIQKDLKLVFPIHPRTRKNIAGTELQARVDAMKILFY